MLNPRSNYGFSMVKACFLMPHIGITYFYITFTLVSVRIKPVKTTTSIADQIPEKMLLKYSPRMGTGFLLPFTAFITPEIQRITNKTNPKMEMIQPIKGR